MSPLDRGYNVSRTVLRDSFSTHNHAHHLCLWYSNKLAADWSKSIPYKLCSLMYRVTHGLAPTYLTDLCEQCSNTICLRSASRGDYILPRSRLRCVNSSFSISAPTARNNKPAHIRIVPICRSFYLHSSLTFSSPLSLISNIIPYSPHTLFQFVFFPFKYVRQLFWCT